MIEHEHSSGSEQAPLTAQIPDTNNPPPRECPTLFFVVELPVFWYLGGLWLTAVIASGAGFVLTLMGACTVSTAWCHSFLNTNNQILTALFTAVNIYAFPGRLARVWRLNNKNQLSLEPHQRSLLAESYDPSTFSQFPFGTRLAISVLFLASALCQFANQGFHIRYDTYEEAMSWPGVLWNNLFFLVSLLSAVIAIGLEAHEDSRIRASHPGRFPPTASVLFVERLSKLCCRRGNPSLDEESFY